MEEGEEACGRWGGRGEMKGSGAERVEGCARLHEYVLVHFERRAEEDVCARGLEGGEGGGVRQTGAEGGAGEAAQGAPGLAPSRREQRRSTRPAGPSPARSLGRG